MAKLPSSNQPKDRLREAVETAGKGNYSHTLDQGRRIAATLKGADVELRQTGENIGRALARLTEPSLQFRTDNHKLLEAIGAPVRSNETIPRLVQRIPSTSNQPNPLTTVEDIGKLVRATRKRMGMTQQRFADLAGVGRRFISELEGGKASLEIGRVMAVCKAAGIDLFARSR